jgi:thiosulfate/3-mercaptopyruvate sulfurtransferase
MSQSMTSDGLADWLSRGDTTVLDVRPMAAFNGWPLRAEARGGHVRGARPFPLTWLSSGGDEEVRGLLEDKEIVPERPIVAYGYDGRDAATAADRLRELGYGDVAIYEPGLPDWASQPDRPMDRMPRFEQLVHPGWLATLLAGGETRTPDGKRWVLIHVNFDNREEYDQEHIPGAIHLDTIALEEPERWNRRPAEELEQALTSHGIGAETRVIVYGRTGRPDMSQAHPGKEAGQIGAMRAAVLMMYAGVRDVRVLDGGLNAWKAEGYPVTDEQIAPRPVNRFGRSLPGRPELIVDIGEARRLLAGEGSELVSVRSWAEFIGEVSGYHYVKPKGRIPGAVFGNCGTDAYHMQNYRNHDNTVRNYHEIAANWRESGVTPDKRVAFYCGTGWRASEACFCAYLMGWDDIAIYDGGWFEWSIDTENPLETGVPDSPPAAFS